MLVVAFIAGVFLIGLYGVGYSEGYIAVSELSLILKGCSGQNINARGVAEDGSLQKAPGVTSFYLTDKNDENLKIYVNYV